MKKLVSFLRSRNGAAFVLACCLVGGIVGVAGLLHVIRGTRTLDGSVSAVKMAVGIHEKHKMLNEIIAPDKMQEAINDGNKVVGGDPKKTFVQIDGRVFAYDKSTGRLLK